MVEAYQTAWVTRFDFRKACHSLGRVDIRSENAQGPVKRKTPGAPADQIKQHGRP